MVLLLQFEQDVHLPTVEMEKYSSEMANNLNERKFQAYDDMNYVMMVTILIQMTVEMTVRKQ